QVGVLSANPSPIVVNAPVLGVAGSTVVGITNNGPSNAEIISATLEGTDSSVFTLSQSCSDVLTVGQVCPMTVGFTPTEAGFHSARLRIKTKIGKDFIVPIEGQGPNAVATLTPESLVFADQVVAETSPARTLTLTN